MPEQQDTAVVVHVLNPSTVVINRGRVDGVRVRQRFLIYALSGDELTDPYSGESLGQLEVVRGTGRVIHVQDRMATIESDRETAGNRTKRIVRREQGQVGWYRPVDPLGRTSGPGETVEEYEEPASSLPFANPSRGDYAKQI